MKVNVIKKITITTKEVEPLVVTRKHSGIFAQAIIQWLRDRKYISAQLAEKAGADTEYAKRLAKYMIELNNHKLLFAKDDKSYYLLPK